MVLFRLKTTWQKTFTAILEVHEERLRVFSSVKFEKLVLLLALWLV